MSPRFRPTTKDVDTMLHEYARRGPASRHYEPTGKCSRCGVDSEIAKLLRRPRLVITDKGHAWLDAHRGEQS